MYIPNSFSLMVFFSRERKNSQQSNPTDSDPVSYEFSADSLLSDSDKVCDTCPAHSLETLSL
jgi:hypothetical protein